MTAASTGPTAAGTPGAGPRPQLLTIAAILLGVAAILGLLFPVSQLSGTRFYGCQIAVASANASPTATSSASGSASASPSAASAAQQQAQFKDCLAGRGAVAPASSDRTSSDTGRLLIQGAVSLVILGGLGFFAFRGVPLVRWFVVGVWVLGGFIGIVPFGPLQALGVVQQSYPPLSIAVVEIGTIAFTAAAVLVNLRPVTRYFSAKRPVRSAGFGGRPTAGGAGGGGGGGGLLGSFFRPRPPAGGTRGTTAGPTVSTTKPPVGGTSSAATRPAGSPAKGKGGGSGNTGRAKGKRRG